MPNLMPLIKQIEHIQFKTFEPCDAAVQEQISKRLFAALWVPAFNLLAELVALEQKGSEGIDNNTQLLALLFQIASLLNIFAESSVEDGLAGKNLLKQLKLIEESLADFPWQKTALNDNKEQCITAIRNFLSIEITFLDELKNQVESLIEKVLYIIARPMDEASLIFFSQRLKGQLNDRVLVFYRISDLLAPYLVTIFQLLPPWLIQMESLSCYQLLPYVNQLDEAWEKFPAHVKQMLCMGLASYIKKTPYPLPAKIAVSMVEYQQQEPMDALIA